MSLKAMSWAIEQDVKPVYKVILMALAMFQNDETGLCCPSRHKLATLANISEATLKRQLAAMESEGWIVRKSRFGRRSGLQTSNEYIINFRKGRRLKMSPLPQYDDEEIQEAQNEPLGNPGGSHVEPPGGSHVEPPTSLKGTLNKRSASGAFSKSPGKKAEPAAPPSQARDPRVGPLMQQLTASLKMNSRRPASG